MAHKDRREKTCGVITVMGIISSVLAIGFFFGFIHNRNPWHWDVTVYFSMLFTKKYILTLLLNKNQ